MSFYRNAVFFVKGMKEFTKSGYESTKKSFNGKDLDVDLSERCILITGANSGIGKAAALALAQRGATIHMVCRSEERGEAAREEIVSSTGNERIHLHVLDMSDPTYVYKFGAKLVADDAPIHVLINNAGCMVNTREVDSNGLEKNFATNTLGTHILTKALLPLLQTQKEPRVITVSSGGMLTQKLQTSDPQSEQMSPFDGTVVYAQNKRQQVVMMQQYSQKYPNVHFSSMHPGWTDTPALRSSMPEFYQKLKSRLRTPEQGADTIVWLASSAAATKHQSGLFFCDRKPVAEHLPLAWTKSSPEEERMLMTVLDACAERFRLATSS